MNLDQLQQQDDDNLRSLAVAFRVVGGLCALCVNFAWLHVIIGFVTLIGGNIPSASSRSGNPGDAAVTSAVSSGVGALFIIAGLTVIVGGYVMGYFGFRAAKGLETRTNWKLCFGTSIAFLLFQPLGLILGILALIVLNRHSVRNSFSQS